MDIEDCEHTHTTEGVCDYCGLYLDDYFAPSMEFSKNYSKVNTSKASILETIEGVPQEVRDKAMLNVQKKQEMTGKKIRNDSKNTFIQLYNAYLELGIPFRPTDLVEKLKLSRKDVNWCMHVSSGTSLSRNSDEDEDKKYASIVIISPVSFIESICRNNDMLDHSEDLKTITRNILDQKDILFSSRPEYVSFAIVKKYAEQKGIQIKSFSKKNKISDNALKRSMKDVEFYFN